MGINRDFINSLNQNQRQRPITSAARKLCPPHSAPTRLKKKPQRTEQTFPGHGRKRRIFDMNTIEEPISNCNQFIDQDEERMNDLTEANWPVISQWIADIRDRPRLVIDNAIRDQALRYASNGWPIFPVPIGTKASHKSAEHSNGQPWGSTTDADEIRRNFKRWPNANVGV